MEHGILTITLTAFKATRPVHAYVDVSLSPADRKLNMDDFSRRILIPAVGVLFGNMDEIIKRIVEDSLVDKGN